MISKKKRIEVFNKFGGKCGFSGTPLEPDWQIDHFICKRHGGTDNIDNLLPCQKIINHYKRAVRLEDFRETWLGKLHEKLANIPKKPRTGKSINRIKYYFKIAGYFGITADKPFEGKFYFEITRGSNESKTLSN